MTKTKTKRKIKRFKISYWSKYIIAWVLVLYSVQLGGILSVIMGVILFIEYIYRRYIYDDFDETMSKYVLNGDKND